MDDVTTRDHIQKHADAVVRGDMDTVAADAPTSFAHSCRNSPRP